MAAPARLRIEWPTLGLIFMTYVMFAAATGPLAEWSVALAVPAVAVLIAFFASLQHEAIHGHPTPWRRLNEALVFPALPLVIPYGRFRDSHLAHHRHAILTDPYDDPESNYLDPAVWTRLPRWLQWLLLANNTLLGRVLVGPAIGVAKFVIDDWRLARAGDRAVRRGWARHLPAVALVAVWVAVAPMPVGAYLLAAYLGIGLLKIRSFLEHQAHDRAGGRTAIVEDQGLLALLFLNNNLHVVHHMHPAVPWYRLPHLYRANRRRYLDRNGGYRYRSYGEVFARHFLRAKDPVPHPFYPRR